MTLNNYRDISRQGTDVGAGFQFEFRCSSCNSAWKSPLKPYRRGQLAGLINKFAFFLGDRGSMGRLSSGVATTGVERAKAQALQEAIELAEERYAVCSSCDKTVCESCWNAGAQRCEECMQQGSRSSARGHSAHREGSPAESGGGAPVALRCPNCSAEHVDGGRFCSECGFDMAATHKSCPSCGATTARSARFCTDCGHGF